MATSLCYGRYLSSGSRHPVALRGRSLLQTDDHRRNHDLAKALPYFGAGDPIPAGRDLRVADDRGSIQAVLYLLLRAWPYIRPQIYGRWWAPGQGIEDRTAEAVAGRGFGFAYMPPLVATVAIGGPYLGYVPATLEYPFNLLYAPILAMALCAWPVALAKGRIQKVSAFALLVFGVAANAAANTYVEGVADGWYAGIVTGACMLGWLLQFRVDGLGGSTRIRCRIRLASHLVYWYGITAIQGVFWLVLGLVLADLLNQSILQSDPLTASRAELFGEPEMSGECFMSFPMLRRGSPETLILRSTTRRLRKAAPCAHLVGCRSLHRQP